MKQLDDKVTVITGAGAGIGRALALELARHGCRLALSGRTEATVAETVELCMAAGAEARGYRLDVSQRDAVFAYADQVERDFGSVNLLINNAGVGLQGSLRDIKLDDFEWLMNINFWGVVYGCQAFLPKLVASGDGHIINISSIFGLIGAPKQGAYNASKFAVRGYTEALRQELEIDNTGVAVSSVHPGFVSTGIAKRARLGRGESAGTTEDLFDRIALTTPEQCARAIVKGIRRNTSRILVGPDAYVVEAMQRLLGARYQPITRTVARFLLY